MGLNQQDVASALTSALGGGYVNYFSIAAAPTSDSQVQQIDRLNPRRCSTTTLDPNDVVVPVRTIAHLETHVNRKPSRISSSRTR